MKTLQLTILFLVASSVKAQDNNALPSDFTSAKVSINGLEVASPGRLRLVIEDPSNSYIRLSKDRIQTKVEMRLRQAGIEPVRRDSSWEFLYLHISVVGSAFNIDVSLHRPVKFMVSRTAFLHTTASTWSEGTTGTHGGESEFIVQSLDKLMDEFINEFLRANPK